MISRDKKGRFTKASEKTNWNLVATIILVILIIAGYSLIPQWWDDVRQTTWNAGNSSGFSAGYKLGQTDTFADAFAKGVETGKNWTLKSDDTTRYYSFSWGVITYCRKDNPSHCKNVDERMNTLGSEYDISQCNDGTWSCIRGVQWL